MLKKEANKITGGLSAPGKMPEGSYNLPAVACQTGAKLRQIPGTPCWGCYAFKGRYNFSNVKDALTRRLESLAHRDWIPAMVVLIKGKKYFRWHDSGDLQSAQHLLDARGAPYPKSGGGPGPQDQRVALVHGGRDTRQRFLSTEATVPSRVVLRTTLRRRRARRFEPKPNFLQPV